MTPLVPQLVWSPVGSTLSVTFHADALYHRFGMLVEVGRSISMIEFVRRVFPCLGVDVLLRGGFLVWVAVLVLTLHCV